VDLSAVKAGFGSKATNMPTAIEIAAKTRTAEVTRNSVRMLHLLLFPKIKFSTFELLNQAPELGKRAGLYLLSMQSHCAIPATTILQLK
jgi:hypothetical protein